MAVQLFRIKGDEVELIYNPKEVDLSVGDSLVIRERTGNRGLIAQIVEFRTASYPALFKELFQLMVEEGLGFPPELLSLLAERPEPRNLNIALAKVRRIFRERGVFEIWNGWIPTRDVVIELIPYKELKNSCMPKPFYPLELGFTGDGEGFCVEGRALEKVNLIVGAKGTGKSYLAKVLLLELVRHGAPCIVFDLNQEYVYLPGVICLRVGVDLKLDVYQFGLEPLLILLRRFGLPEVSAMYFCNRLIGILEEVDRIRASRGRPPFIGIRQLIQLAEEGEYSPSEAVNLAIRARLELIKKIGLLAERPEEATVFLELYRRIREGGALIVDISHLSSPVRYAFLQAMVEILREICEIEIRSGTNRFPFVFFEEAHLYLPANTIGWLVSRARHLGLTTFFITNMIGGLDEAVLRQVDNLFVFRLPFDEDVQYLGKCGLVDEDTLQAFVKHLPNQHALFVGNITNLYPVIVKVKELKGIKAAGETRHFFPKGQVQVPLPM